MYPYCEGFSLSCSAVKVPQIHAEVTYFCTLCDSSTDSRSLVVFSRLKNHEGQVEEKENAKVCLRPPFDFCFCPALVEC